ncbi:MAG: hypothetical protein A3K10_10230 [Bacteroidetes bacterium RIFCSPLOWO2_12_FULL_31_6]|nr:MAG: hypothetical protein A3K10_10230 [Bacteroidetes bacterium RIFCSPLOWO2_12_FULL_31_6]
MMVLNSLKGFLKLKTVGQETFNEPSAWEEGVIKFAETTDRVFSAPEFFKDEEFESRKLLPIATQ